MSARTEKKAPLSPTARAEAAAWVARLHGPKRTPEVEAGFRRWLAEDPERPAAFELLTDVWEKSGQLRRRPFEHVKSWQLPGFRMSLSRAALAAAAIAGIAVIGTVFYVQTGAISTGIGEQRTLVLEDDTRVYLNTDTRALVQYDKGTRRVNLEKGEALFEVAKHPGWPFIVQAGSSQVKALGTSFVVRRDQDRVAVTLVDGKVAVSRSGTGSAQPNPTGLARSPTVEPATKGPKLEQVVIVSRKPEPVDAITLEPGERLTLVGNRSPQLDTPRIDRIIAWQRGQVLLDDTPLADAVAEMNRYSTVRVVIDDPRAAGIRVSGVFRAGDVENFAQAVRQGYHLDVVRRGEEIVVGSAAGTTGEVPTL